MTIIVITQKIFIFTNYKVSSFSVKLLQLALFTPIHLRSNVDLITWQSWGFVFVVCLEVGHE